MVPLGIPHSTFLAWSADDQDKALAWMVRKSEACPSCGTNPDTWVTPDGELVIPPPYEPHSFKCEGCRQRSLFEKSFDKDGPPAGTSIVLIPSDETEYDEETFVGPPRAER